MAHAFAVSRGSARVCACVLPVCVCASNVTATIAITRATTKNKGRQGGILRVVGHELSPPAPILESLIRIGLCFEKIKYIFRGNIRDHCAPLKIMT